MSSQSSKPVTFEYSPTVNHFKGSNTRYAYWHSPLPRFHARHRYSAAIAFWDSFALKAYAVGSNLAPTIPNALAGQIGRLHVNALLVPRMLPRMLHFDVVHKQVFDPAVGDPHSSRVLFSLSLSGYINQIEDTLVLQTREGKCCNLKHYHF